MMLFFAERKRNETQDRRENCGQWAHGAPPYTGQIVQPIGKEKAFSWLGGPASNDCLHAPTASCPPSGRKYCVPLIGSVTLRNSSCKSSLRSTKSISDVLTISRSGAV